MYQVKDKCNKCQHHAVCKYSESYMKFDSEDLNLNFNTDVINVEVTCKHFREITTHVKEGWR